MSKLGHDAWNLFRAGGLYSPALGFSNAGGGTDRFTPQVTCRASELERPQCNCPVLGPFLLGLFGNPGPTCRDLTAGVPNLLKPLFYRLDARVNLAAPQIDHHAMTAVGCIMFPKVGLAE